MPADPAESDSTVTAPDSDRHAALAGLHTMLVREIPRLRRYARFLVRDREKADDLVQDCLARAIARLSSWEPGTNMRAWLFVIMHNHYISYWRREKRSRLALDATNEAIILAMATDGNQEQRLEMRELQEAFNRLDDEQQQILLMVAVDGLRYEDAAAALNIPVGTVRSRLFRARAALRELMETPPVRADGTQTMRHLAQTRLPNGNDDSATDNPLRRAS